MKAKKKPAVYSPEYKAQKLKEIQRDIASGAKTQTAIANAGINVTNYYNWMRQEEKSKPRKEKAKRPVEHYAVSQMTLPPAAPLTGKRFVFVMDVATALDFAAKASQ